MTEFTPWFPPSMPPEHAGVYEAEWDSEHPEIDSGEWYNKWDGARWYLGDMSTRNAEKQKRLMPSRVKLIRWRGLTHNLFSGADLRPNLADESAKSPEDAGGT